MYVFLRSYTCLLRKDLSLGLAALDLLLLLPSQHWDSKHTPCPAFYVGGKDLP